MSTIVDIDFPPSDSPIVAQLVLVDPVTGEDLYRSADSREVLPGETVTLTWTRPTADPPADAA